MGCVHCNVQGEWRDCIEKKFLMYNEVFVLLCVFKKDSFEKMSPLKYIKQIIIRVVKEYDKSHENGT